jgi:putative addiction module component (TIGR02574 family)
MSTTLSTEEIRSAASALPTGSKWELANQLFEQVEADPAWPPLPKGYFDEMDRRVEEYLRDPSKGSKWEEVKARILATRKRG